LMASPFTEKSDSHPIRIFCRNILSNAPFIPPQICSPVFSSPLRCLKWGCLSTKELNLKSPSRVFDFTFMSCQKSKGDRRLKSGLFFFRKQLIAPPPLRPGKYVGQRCQSFHFSQKDKHFPHKCQHQAALKLQKVEKSPHLFSVKTPS